MPRSPARFECSSSSSASTAARCFSGQPTAGVWRVRTTGSSRGARLFLPCIVRETLPYSLRKVLEGHPFWFANLDELPPEAAADRAFFEKHGPRSNLSFPLVVGGSAVGGLAFGTIQREREWPEALRDRLAVVAHIFANALERKRSDLALQHAYAEVTQLKERLELDNQYLRQELATRRGRRRDRRAERGDESRAG